MQLKEVANMVQKMIQENFVTVALGEENDRDAENYRYARSPVGREESSDTLYEIGLEERLLPLIIGLLRLGKIRQALQTYRERAQKTLKRSFSKACVVPVTHSYKAVIPEDVKLIAPLYRPWTAPLHRQPRVV